MIRKPVVAGQFYPADKVSLVKMLDGLFEQSKPPAPEVKAAVVPHAGYIYSGKVAAGFYSICPKEIETAVIIGPNHTGLGNNYSFMKNGVWHTPLGEVAVDAEVATQISKGAEILEEDFEAHRLEHSIEVQLPFLQYINPQVKIVPIVLASHNLEDLSLIAHSIGRAVSKGSRKIVVIASSDLTHYEEIKSAEAKDKKVIEAIVALDDKRLIQDIKQYSISMCGAAPCYVAVNFAKDIGSKGARLIKYQTSADVSGDYTSVVGYASIVLG